MFDTVIHKTETKVTPVTRVIEKSITPDKVTDMYDSVREEVEKAIVRKIVIDDNSIKGSITEIKDCRTMARKIIVRFTLNRKEYIHKKVIEYEQTREVGELLQYLYEYVAQEVANDLMKQNLPHFILR